MKVLVKNLAQHGDQTVEMEGWLYAKRSGGKVVFLQFRDGTGVCQCVVEASAEEAFDAANQLSQESSFRLTGVVRLDDRAPGGAEVNVSSLEIVHLAEEFPISRKAHGIDFLMHHRHLWLRSRRPHAVLRIRHRIIKAARDFFDERGFTLVDTPILTSGAGEDSQTLFNVDYFGDEAFLAQTGQLYLESAAMAFEKVYCFGPTFRAEKSKTRRHLTEFWMLEPEIAYADLDDVVALAEDMICAIVGEVLSHHREELIELGRDVTRLEAIQKPFPRITYSEAVDILKSPETRQKLEQELEQDKQELAETMQQIKQLDSQLEQTGKKWKQDQLKQQIHDLREHMHELELRVSTAPDHMQLAADFVWGKDLGGSDETIISRHFDLPVFVTDYPKEAKAFYMKISDEDPRVVRNVDMLAPEGYGEVIGGSQREENLEVLIQRIQEHGLNPDDYSWYLDLRRYGSVPHGGFGLGIERAVTWLCGLKHVRETIPFARMMGKLYP
jgi:asparaginyl-tRNA synthetase